MNENYSDYGRFVVDSLDSADGSFMPFRKTSKQDKLYLYLKKKI